MFLDKDFGFAKMDELGKHRVPFLFVVSYDKSKIYVSSLEELDGDIQYKLEDWRNYSVEKREKKFIFSKTPIHLKEYKKSLDIVLEHIRAGNTYLLNLTFKTDIKSSLSLKEMFLFSRAKFKLYFKDQFICFSPERFIEINGDTISTYPMKGTIDANMADAKNKILNNEKEMAEHVMIVDLMRNDLGMVANDVVVERFRYIDNVRAGDKELLQVSSKITAKLSTDWRDNIGQILNQILPAGSITGAPKKKTIEIINNVEDYDRDFYTGVFGVFDGDSLRSGVMIRFIEKDREKLVYKSGGGITIDSDAKLEYEELLDKIYLPI